MNPVHCFPTKLGCWLIFAGLTVFVTSAAGDEPPVVAGAVVQPALTLDCLAHMSWPQLEALYRQASPGTIPQGYTRGRPIYCPDEVFSGPRSHATSFLWHGKHFCDANGTLTNQWLGVKAVRARVAYGPSWLDGKPSIIMDYAGMSWVWNDVRDEVREVAPGLYLGLMYRRHCPEPTLKMYFALETSCPCQR